MLDTDKIRTAYNFLVFRFHDDILVLEEFCTVDWSIVPFEFLEIFFFPFDKIFVRGLFYHHECHVDSGIRTFKYLCWREKVSSRDDERVINLERPFYYGRLVAIGMMGHQRRS